MDDCTVVRAASLYLIKRDKDADIHYLIIVGRQQWLLPCLLKRSVLWPAESPMNKALHSLPDKRRAVVQVRWPWMYAGLCVGVESKGNESPFFDFTDYFQPQLFDRFKTRFYCCKLAASLQDA